MIWCISIGGAATSGQRPRNAIVMVTTSSRFEDEKPDRSGKLSLEE
jgi:hypothetical protein